MDILVVPLIKVLMLLLASFRWVLVIYAILSWLIAFNLLNTRNLLIYRVNDVLFRLIEPLLSPLRSILPNLGGIDLSFFVLFLIVVFMENMLLRVAARFLVYMM
jgi:YggT family protein